MRERHIITPEYPPQVGGVSDYTALLAQELRATGETVHVWAPGSEDVPSRDSNLHRVLGAFDAASLVRTDKLLNQYPAPRSLLVQWVPHGYGRRSMNVGFCRWLARRVRRHGDSLQLMVHEPFLEFRGIRQSAAATVHRWMIHTLLGVAEHVWLSIPAWEAKLRRYAPAGLKMDWLPIPSGIAATATPESSKAVRAKLGDPSLLAGHLGTYSPVIRTLLEPVIIELLRKNPDLSFLMLGSGSKKVRAALSSHHPDLKHRLFATDYLPSAELSPYLAACDLLIQPYPDGASSRRTSLMAGISHGIPVLTTSGHLSESLWRDSAAVAIVAANDSSSLLALAQEMIFSPEKRSRLASAGLRLYRKRFDWPQVIRVLTDASMREKPATIAVGGHQPR
jgi:glycosyltransferase involved in cell wall biosynthesis